LTLDLLLLGWLRFRRLLFFGCLRTFLADCLLRLLVNFNFIIILILFHLKVEKSNTEPWHLLRLFLFLLVLRSRIVNLLSGDTLREVAVILSLVERRSFLSLAVVAHNTALAKDYIGVSLDN